MLFLERHQNVSGFKVILNWLGRSEIANVSFKKPSGNKNLKNSQKSTLFKNYFKTLPMTPFLVNFLVIQETLFKHVNVSGIIINSKKWTTKRCPVGYRSIRFWVSSMNIARGKLIQRAFQLALGFLYVWC